MTTAPHPVAVPRVRAVADTMMTTTTTVPRSMVLAQGLPLDMPLVVEETGEIGAAAMIVTTTPTTLIRLHLAVMSARSRASRRRSKVSA